MNDVSELTIREKCYRHQRANLVIGVIASIWGSAMVGCLIAMSWDIDGAIRYSKPTMIFFSLFWLLFTISSLHLILAYYREKLIVNGKAISHYGLTRLKILQVDHVDHVYWCGLCAPGTVVLKTPDTKLKIYLGNFTKDDREQLITFSRNAFDLEIQSGWSRFVDLHVSCKPVSPDRSHQKAKLSACLFFTTGSIFTYCSIIGSKSHWLIPAISSGVGCVLSLWRIVRIDRNQVPRGSRSNRVN